MKVLKILIIFIVLVFFMPLHIQAKICFKIKPSPECRFFSITEIGVGQILSPKQTEYFISDLGFMINLNKRYAFGVTHYMTLDGRYTNFRGGLKFRIRRWLNRSMSLNFGTGVLVWGGGRGGCGIPDNSLRWI